MITQSDDFTTGCCESICNLTLENDGLLNLHPIDLVDVLR